MYFNNGGNKSSGGNDYRPPQVPVTDTYPSSYGHSTSQPNQFQNQNQQQQQWSATSGQQNQFNGFQSHQNHQSQADPNDPFASLVAASNPSSQPQRNNMMMMNQPMQSQFSVQQQQQFQPMGQQTMSGMNSNMDPFATANNFNMSSMGTALGNTNPDPFAPSVPSTMNPPSASAMFDPMGAPAPTQSMQHQPMSLQQQQSFGGQPIMPAPSASMPPPVPGQTPVINGMFLGLEAKQPEVQESEEDKEFRRAQEAAMYAEEILRKQKEDKEREKNKFTLGNLAGKVENFLQGPAPTTRPASSGTSFQNKPSTPVAAPRAYGGGQVADISVDDVDYGGSDEEEERRPPWFAARTKTPQNDTPKKANPTTTAQSPSDDKPGTAAAIGGAAALGGVAGLSK